VSPKSRSRNPVKRQSNGRQPNGRQPSRSRLREPQLRLGRDFLVQSLAVLADSKKVQDAYNAEAMVSVLLGQLAAIGVRADRMGGVLLDVIDELARRDDDSTIPALRTLAVVGPPEVAAYAASRADLGTSDREDAPGAPPWLGDLGDVTLGSCLAAADPFGQSQVILARVQLSGRCFTARPVGGHRRHVARCRHQAGAVRRARRGTAQPENGRETDGRRASRDPRRAGRRSAPVWHRRAAQVRPAAGH
jgi:hypothetical protein